ncbi:tripartite tricarboxylate transporter substrate-binding protein [Pigmentiphaga sp. CHJ604]|uniref:Bug family tripartite tricarboxylate transporter substrate binding protein n=1 Tax=Pigmentiphaga sp. CHJ604 TaxID=3081984 RepID=UPI0030D2234D
MKSRRNFLAALFACMTMGGNALAADGLSDKPIRIIVPFAAGANSDVVTRMIAQQVTDNGGPSFFIDNRPGGGGTVGAVAAKRAEPDGHTLFAANIATHAVLQSIQSLPYDPVKDFRPITELFYFPTYLIVPERLPVKSVSELIALAKAKPDGLSFGSQGIGSTPHLLGAMLQHEAGANLVHIPYAAGGGPMNIDLVAGRLDMVFSTYASMNPHRESGKVRFLAIASSKRSDVAPEVPTLAEAGYSGVELDNWFGRVAPAGTPDAVIDELNQLFVKAANDPAIVAKLKEQGITMATQSPAEFGALMAADAERVAKVVKATGIKLD